MAFTYDNDGQRLSTPTAVYDTLQRLTTLSGTSLSYLSPGNGELVSYGTTSYQNNLLGAGRLIPSSGTATDLIRTPNGATIAQRVGTTSKQDLFTDALGSTFATADDNATTLAKHYTYDPDGNATGTGTGTTPSVLYAGGIQIGGLYHYGARYYDPSTATWTQQDPLNQIASLTQANHYIYAGGDPIDNIDPVGSNFFSDAADVVKSAVRGAVVGGANGCVVGAAVGAAADGIGAAAGCAAGAESGAEDGAVVGGASEIARKVNGDVGGDATEAAGGAWEKFQDGQELCEAYCR
jgi:RHS repeat-associated protein